MSTLAGSGPINSFVCAACSNWARGRVFLGNSKGLGYVAVESPTNSGGMIVRRYSQSDARYGRTANNDGKMLAEALATTICPGARGREDCGTRRPGEKRKPRPKPVTA